MGLEEGRDWRPAEVTRCRFCSSWGECKSSIGSDCTFKEGQLSHLGKHFDLSLDGRELRVVVVGQEVAGKGKARTTMAERYANVHDGSGMKKRFISDADHTSRNPHMKGTTLALRTILGLPGTDHESEFLNIGGKPVHIFDCFALVNRLLCAAHLEGTSNGKSTTTMLNNCERHFRATLEILEPTIVVIQGVRMWKWSKSVLRPREKLADHLFRCDLGGRAVLVAPFTHPSAPGKAPLGLPYLLILSAGRPARPGKGSHALKRPLDRSGPIVEDRVRPARGRDGAWGPI